MIWNRLFTGIMSIAVIWSLAPFGSASAQTAAPGMTIQYLTNRGSGRLEVSPAPSNISPEQTTTEYFPQRPDVEFGIPRGASSSSVTPTAGALSVPEVAGSQVKNAANAVKSVDGFAGLSHKDQREAGTDSFANTQFSLEPPDQALCVGADFVVEAVNSAMAVYDRSGKRLAGPTSLNQFYNLTPEIVRSKPPIYGDFISDPKCLYDATTGRFFMTVLQINVNPQTGKLLPVSHVEIAVSENSDPTGDWDFFRLDTTDDGLFGTPKHPGCAEGCFGDQPLIGADANGFFITTNEFSIDGATFNGAQVYALSKRSLTRDKMPSVVHFDNLKLAEDKAYSLQPAVSPGKEQFNGDDDGTEYFLSALDFKGTLDNRIAIWSITNTRSLGDRSPQIKIFQNLITSETYGQPPNANQKVGPIPLGDTVKSPEETLQTNDDRMNQTVYVNGRLYSAVNSVITVGGEKKAGIAYFVVKPHGDHDGVNGSIDRQGYIAVQDNHVFFPSIGVTSEGTAVMTFTLSGADHFPSAAMAVIDKDHPDVLITAEGAQPEDGFTGYPSLKGENGDARWGDYSAAVSDGKNVWLAVEYIPGGDRTDFANWGTFISKISP